MSHETSLNHSALSLDPKSTTGEIRHVQEDEGIDLMEVALILMRGKKTIFRFMAIFALLTAILVYLILKPNYTAEVVFIAPQASPGSNMSQLASQLGSLGAIGALGGFKSTEEIYLSILGSRTISDELIKRFDLQKVYKIKLLSDTEKALKKHSKFVSGKDTLIRISVEDHDPKRAADMANAYLASLRAQNGRLALTESAQRRLFFEQQLEREKNSLADVEVDLKKTQEQTGLIAPGGQAQVAIETNAVLRAQIASRQVELAALKQSATDQNPSVVRLQAEIAGMQQQLARLQNDTSRRQPGSVQLPTAEVPELALEYVRKQREVKYHEVLFELIARQYEAARLDESREAPLLQVVDNASIPDKKSGLGRVLLIILGSLSGALVGTFWVISRHIVETLRQDPEQVAKLNALREAVKFTH